MYLQVWGFKSSW